MGSHLIFGFPATLAMVGLGIVALRRTRREAIAHTELQQEVAPPRTDRAVALNQARRWKRSAD